MIELGQKYFSSISTRVNDIAYNSENLNSNNIIYCGNRLNDLTLNRVTFSIKSENFCVLQLNNKHTDDLKIIENIGVSLFGPTICEKNPGKYPYAKVQCEKNAKYYINSNFAQPMHTDEGYTFHFPRYVILYCANAARSGGDNAIIRLETLYYEMKKLFGEAVDLLFEKDAVTVKTAFGIEKKPILFWLDDGSLGISYSVTLQKMWCSRMVLRLFNHITNYIHTTSNQIRIRLKPGQMLVFDNCKILHGRTAFNKDDPRLLYRYWFKSTNL